jgi:hypothetical protein
MLDFGDFGQIHSMNALYVAEVKTSCKNLHSVVPQ